MQLTYSKYNQFQRQCNSQHDIIKIQQLRQQINRLEQYQISQQQKLSTYDKKDINKYIRIYRLAIKQIQKMKMQFTKPSLVKQKLSQIFNNQIQMEQIISDRVMDKTQDIRSSEIQLPTFKKPTKKQNVIDANDLASPALRSFFQKKEAQINNKAARNNFKSIIQTSQKQSFRLNNRSVSRQHPSMASRSSASSFKRPNQQAQLKKVLQENKKIKQQYEKKIKKQLQLSEFQKNLLKQQKNRYMLKIEQLQNELQKLYRTNYRLKQQVQIKQKTIKQRSQFDRSSQFQNIDENINGPVSNGKDYYQPYVMNTKHNDLKRLNDKCHQDFQNYSHNSHVSQYNKNNQYNNNNQININNEFFNNVPIQKQISQKQITNNQFNTINNKLYNNIQPYMNNQYNGKQPVIDILGNQLQKQLQQIQKQKSKSNVSHRSSSKKWTKQFNPDKYSHQQENDQLLKVLKDDDQDQFNTKNYNQNNHISYKPSQQNNNKNTFQMSNKNPFYKKQSNDSIFKQFNNVSIHSGHQLNYLPPTLTIIPPQRHSTSNSFAKNNNQPLQYKPVSNYSFTKANNKDYSIASNNNNYDTFQLTKTYLNMTQNQQSQTNKYIDSRTSTRNKVAFFKDSLILIKNQTFQLAYKRSSLVQTKDRVRVIFFIKNKTNQAITVNFRYEYDASYFKLKVNQKMQTVSPFGQSRQDLQVYAYSTADLNQVIDIMVDFNFDKYGLWMPILWIQFKQNDYFKLPDQNQQINVIPDRQFKSYQTAKTIMPLMFGGQDFNTQWAYLYGVSKFGPCYVKLTWEGNQLKIQTHAKWIDLLAFVMHHVK